MKLGWLFVLLGFAILIGGIVTEEKVCELNDWGSNYCRSTFFGFYNPILLPLIIVFSIISIYGGFISTLGVKDK